ncbi:MAG: hypothetical protein ACYC6X_02485 [Minisyncoccota bacterium]
MGNLSKALKFIGLEALISIPLFLIAIVFAYDKIIEVGSSAVAIGAIALYLVVTAISIFIFDNKFVYEDRLRFPSQVGVVFVIIGVLFGGANIIYGIISFIVLWIFLKIKFRNFPK